MSKRKIAGKQIKPPKFPNHELERGQLEASMLDRAYHAQLAISHDDLSGQLAEHITFDQILFQQVHLNKTRFKKVLVLDSRFSACDFANAEWAEATLDRVELIGCHLTGLQCGEAQLQDVFFKGCQGSFSQFALATFKSVRFEDCDLNEVNFMEVDLSGTMFVNCDLRNVDFTGTRLNGVDLRTCQLEGARVGPRELQGATINPVQAMAFLQGIGISVKPPDNIHFDS